MTTNRLIILRGPSGAGKSTIACQLQKDAQTDTLIIEQDYYRHMLLANKPDDKKIVPEMVYVDTMIALKAGYNVILEGIFRKSKYLPAIQRIMKDFVGNTYIYYFNIGFDETVNRHSSRAKSEVFDADEMKEWYHLAEPLGIDHEQYISEDMKIQETIKLIQKQTNL